MENSGGEGGLAILEFGGQGGIKHFGISEGRGRVWIFSGITHSEYEERFPPYKKFHSFTGPKSFRGFRETGPRPLF